MENEKLSPMEENKKKQKTANPLIGILFLCMDLELLYS